MTIGRESPSHLKLPNEETLSREHAQLKIRPPVGHLVDCDSSNGTWVNGVRLLAATLSHGDRFGVGDTEIAFEVFHKSRQEKISHTKRADSLKHHGKSSDSNQQEILPATPDIDPVAHAASANTPA